MTASSEQNPSGEIRDIETFKQWVNRYRETAMSDPALRHEVVEDGINAGRVLIAMYDYPWEEVPISIREIIAIQYEAALVDPEKTVDISVTEDSVDFDLHSRFITHGIDNTSETYSYAPVELIFNMDHESTDFLNGTWSIHKTAASAPTLGRIIFEKTRSGQSITEEAQKLSRLPIHPSIGVTLPQLQDVARVLTAARPQAIVIHFQKPVR